SDRQLYPNLSISFNPTDIKPGTIIPYKVTISRQGRKLLLIGGFRFSKEKQYRNGKTRWHCSTHHNNQVIKCKAYAHTLADVIIRLRNDHTHGLPNFLKCVRDGDVPKRQTDDQDWWILLQECALEHSQDTMGVLHTPQPRMQG
ncbi:uncharacterized protein LOC114359686, partial [Ostrinia furnacalis]|uniref:uncharacterized protein LOC114359686 n=1 Tax=Ostrinia furnacalis TaxID=93504 RepID=UPI00103FDBFB